MMCEELPTQKFELITIFTIQVPVKKCANIGFGPSNDATQRKQYQTSNMRNVSCTTEISSKMRQSSHPFNFFVSVVVRCWRETLSARWQEASSSYRTQDMTFRHPKKTLKPKIANMNVNVHIVNVNANANFWGQPTFIQYNSTGRGPDGQFFIVRAREDMLKWWRG